MINKDDGLSILNGIIQCSENKFDLSNNENLEYFMKSYPPDMLCHLSMTKQNLI